MTIGLTTRHWLLGALLGATLASPALAGKEKKDLVNPADPVIGVAEPLGLSPDLSDSIESGNRLHWIHVLQYPMASFVKAHLVNVNLRAGDTLTLRSTSGKVVEEIRGRGPKDFGTFWALSAYGDELILEFSFQQPYDDLPFAVDQVIPGIPGLFDNDLQEPESICSPAQFEDVFCYQGDPGKWSNVLASVGVMSVGGNPTSALFCSGSNVSPQNYLLTNDHCLSTQADCNSSEFVFKYYRTGCNNGAPTTTDWQGFRCSAVVANSPIGSCDQGLNDLDFSLCSVIGDPSSTFGFVTPDPVPLTDGEAIYIIQHPAGRPHEIAHGSGANVDVDGTVLRYYDTLDTEGGSSGSPIYREADDKLVGLHHCGGCATSGVGNRGMLMSDIYPHIAPFVCSPTLDVRAAGVSPPQEVSGNGDTVMEPGETWEIFPSVSNVACSVNALGVTANFQVSAGSAPVTLLDTSASFGDVPAGQSAVAAASVRFQVDSSAVCGDSISLDMINLTASNGGPFGDSNGFFVNSLGDEPLTTLFFDDFSSGLAAWQIQDLGTGTGPARTWTTANPGNRSLGLTAPFAICDSDNLGTGFSMDETMTSPVVDCSAYASVLLQFQHDFTWYSGGQVERAEVDVRSSLTGTWVNVVTFTGSSTSGMVELDLTAQAAGAADLQVRFHYYNAVYEWWWAVDDVTVIGSNGFVCQNAAFTSYGAGCAGSAGFTPTLAGSGNGVPGGTITIDLAGAEPSRLGFLLAAGIPDTSGGCILVLPPITPILFPSNALGTASVSGPIPGSVLPGTHFYLQWFGLDSSGPPASKSTALDVLVQ